MSRKESVRRWLWYFSIPAATILLYKLSDNLGQAIGVVGTLIKILAPFVGGFILAFFLYGPSAWLENRLLKLKGKAWPKLARPLALTVVYLLLFGLLTLLVEPGTPLAHWVAEGSFTPLTPYEIAAETRLMLEHLDSEGSVFRSNHASNYVALAGTLNADRPAMIEKLDRALEGGRFRSESARRF